MTRLTKSVLNNVKSTYASRPSACGHARYRARGVRRGTAGPLGSAGPGPSGHAPERPRLAGLARRSSRPVTSIEVAPYLICVCVDRYASTEGAARPRVFVGFWRCRQGQPVHRTVYRMLNLTVEAKY